MHPDLHAQLVYRAFGVGADFVVALGDDRDAGDLAEQFLGQFVDLRSRHLTASEQSKVDTKLERGQRGRLRREHQARFLFGRFQAIFQTSSRLCHNCTASGNAASG